MNFIADYNLQAEPTEGSLLLMFENNTLLVEQTGDGFQVPSVTGSGFPLVDELDLHYIGSIADKPCFAVLMESGIKIPEGFQFLSLIQLFGSIEDPQFAAACFAYHIVPWHWNSKYCGRCGSLTQFLAEERGKQCVECGLVLYPGISPCIIVAVVRNRKELLLAELNRSDRMRYSVLAGFVETGETLEHCVRREVREEVGIEVRNIKYFGSQPWAFSQSLMVAFTAEYDSGEVTVDGKEVRNAGWFLFDQLPSLPSKVSISRQLIDWFIEKYGN